MNFSAFVARRYLFSKKSHNIVNIISIISVFGVATGAMALLIVLSVYNGFDSLIKSMFNTFDPDIKITAIEGKVFDPQNANIDSIKNLKYVDYVCPTLEELALLEYDKKNHAAVVKGVSPQYKQMTGVDTMMYEGQYKLQQGDRQYALVGRGISYYLSIGLNFLTPIKIYVPKRSGHISMNPTRAFTKKYIFPSGIFSIQNDIDNKYIIVPLKFARNLLGYPTQVSALEIGLNAKANKKQLQEQIIKLVGNKFNVKNKYQQNEMLYRVMKSEKWAIYMILTFILIIAAFNIIGSLSMLIIEKKQDVVTLSSLGADKKKIQKIFLYQGWTISIGGAFVGLILGAVICWLQQKYGLIKLSSMGAFIIENYPVKMKITDVLGIIVTVVTIGFFTSWYPVKYFTKNLDKKNNYNTL